MKSKNQKSKKLSLKKIQVMKLNNLKSIKGGAVGGDFGMPTATKPGKTNY